MASKGKDVTGAGQESKHVWKPTDVRTLRPYGGEVRFSISIPQRDSNGFDAAGLRSYLTRAEEAGFEGGWTLEQVVGEAPLLAPLELLAYAAACTERLRLGVGVLVSSLHDPLQLAAAVTAVDRLSHGRLDLGVAPGGAFRQFPAFGVQKETFVGRFTEGLQLMKAAWSDAPRVTFDGRFRQVDDLPIQPKPVQRPHPPITIGGRGRTRTLRTAARWAQQWNAITADPGEWASLKQTLVEHCQTLGRDPAEITCSVNVRIDPDQGLGPAVATAAAYRAAGADLAIMNLPHGASPDTLAPLADALRPLT